MLRRILTVCMLLVCFTLAYEPFSYYQVLRFLCMLGYSIIPLIYDVTQSDPIYFHQLTRFDLTSQSGKGKKGAQ